jgi:hypothetical protein
LLGQVEHLLAPFPDGFERLEVSDGVRHDGGRFAWLSARQ